MLAIKLTYAIACEVYVSSMLVLSLLFKEDEQKKIFETLLFINTIALAIDIPFFVITLVLFIWAGYFKHRTAFREYLVKFSLQVLGTTTALGIILF